ncbi:GMP synthase (glutamine-hydrolyzing) [Beauveria bassiana]|nr:GMP synthase (glutamine-hydrolyzing) [Beauveria bassiana]
MSVTDVETEPHKLYDTILVLDFGSQFSHLLIRRMREFNVYAELLPCTQKAADLAWKPKGIILSGGPYSVYEDGAPHVDPAWLDYGVPILGICYGMQELAYRLSPDNVIAGTAREYGLAVLNASKVSGHVDRLFEGIGEDMRCNFAVGICQAQQKWTMASLVDQWIMRIRNLVGTKGQVLGAVSGGVDSTVAAKLMHEAIGDRFHAVMVDNGCLRLDEAKKVKETLEGHLGINLTVVDASKQFLDGLAGVTDPEAKRRFIGGKFIDIFEAEAERIEKEASHSDRAGKVEFFLQGTLYPDVIESISFKGPSQTIKTHHNVGGLPKRMTEGHGLKLIEPLRELFKDEVRELGRQLGLHEELVMRHPFPGPGIAIRVLGEVTPERVEIARRADNIFINMIRENGLYNEIGQAFAALDPSRAVGVMGDKRVYQYIIILRAIQTKDFMSANPYPFDHKLLNEISTRITNEVDGVCRVVYDVTSKPPGTIELE